MKAAPVLASLLLTLLAGCTKPPPLDIEEIRPGYDRWKEAKDTFTAAFRAARPASGKSLSPELTALRDAAEQKRKAFLASWEEREDLPGEASYWIGIAREGGRDYVSASDAYERAILDAPEGGFFHDALYRISMAALNSKDEARTAHWMKYFLDYEKHLPEAEQRGQGVRRIYYPRVLAGLGRLEALLAHSETLEGEDPGAARQARFLALMGLARTGEAEALLDGILAEPERFAGRRGWAISGKLAFLTARRAYSEAEELLASYLAAEPDPEALAPERNARRRLASVAEFLGKPARAVRVDHWVGVERTPEGDPLEAFPGKVIVLDFWQPWCEPCRRAMPALVALERRLPGIEVLGLCRIEDSFYDPAEKKVYRPVTPAEYPGRVAKFRKDMGLNYPLGIADGRDNNDAWKIQGIPTLVVIDRDGIVRYMSIGAGEKGLLELAVEGVAGE